MKRSAESGVPMSFDDRVYQAVAETFRALGDPTRVRIVQILASGERTVNGLADLLEVSPSAVSHQLRVLRQMRLVRVRRSGREAHYELDDPHIDHLLKEALLHVRDFMEDLMGPGDPA